jgi:acetyl-CoA carboxylase biotin carboxyl carrier protein
MAAHDIERSRQVIAEAKEVIRMVMESGSVRRVCLGAGRVKIELERAFASGGAAPAEVVPSAAAEPGPPPDPRHRVLSPLVGTFRLAEKPGGKPLVEVGMRVEAGQTVGIIDVLGIKNPVPADVAGVVEEILVADGQRVQFDQPLLVINPAAS